MIELMYVLTMLYLWYCWSCY